FVPPTTVTSPEDLRPTFSKWLLPSHKDNDFFWLTDLEDRIARSPSPKMTHPAVETTGQMQEHESDLMPQGTLTEEQPEFTLAQEWNLGNGCGVWSDDQYLLQGTPQFDFAASEMAMRSWAKPMQPVAVNYYVPNSPPTPTEEEWNHWLIAQSSTEIPAQGLSPSYDIGIVAPQPSYVVPTSQPPYPSPQLVYRPPSPDRESEISPMGSFSNDFTFTPSPRTEEYTLPSPTDYYSPPQSTHDLPPFLS
ncbi:hypothetical protein MPER_11445, partial [Moniliophthora perniciosa FA553]